MSSIRTGVGLVSGINIDQIVNGLIKLQRAPVVRLEQRVTGLQSVETGIKTLEANLLTLTNATQQLNSTDTFNSFAVTNSDTAQFSVTTNTAAQPGTFRFQAVREATSNSVLSKGFANSNQQTFGTGTLTVSTGGFLNAPTLLDSLNSGNGVRRGTVRITDRGGNSADVDLANTYTVADVLDAINSNTTISVTAGSKDGQIILTDTSGATANNLTVIDVNAGHTAEDLGIKKSVANNTLTGGTVYQITGDFTLDQINDGNGIRLLKGAPDIRVTLTDDTTIEVNLDTAVTIQNIIDTINNDPNNGGKLTAALANDRLVLTDNSGGGGSSTFSIQDINNTNVVGKLGLSTTAVGTTITGGRLTAGLNSVLLRNLRGGQGIGQIGQISLTDRAGVTATVDLTGAESLDEVLATINSAKSTGQVKLQLTANINAAGTGIDITETSGATTSNLIISDVGGSTLAGQLGITVNAAQTSVNSGRLNFRYVNEATSISNYAPDGDGVQAGSILIVDSAGNQKSIAISSAVKNVGDVIQRINAASGISVRAELNQTGDGFVIIDEAAGGNPLRIEEVGGSTAADLRILGNGVVGSDGKYRIESRFAAVVNVQATDTLDDIVTKINNTAGFVSASIFDDGSAFNATRLSLTSNTAGSAGRLVIDDGGLGFNFNTLVAGNDALLRIGDSVGSGFLIASETNTFQNATTGVDVEILKPGTTSAAVTVSRDTSKIESSIQSFVDSYNRFIDSSNKLTAFDFKSRKRGPLQGKGIVLRIRGRFDSLINKRFLDSSKSVRTLIDIGVRTGEGGKLIFKKDQLQSAMNTDVGSVIDFFTQADTGFAAKAQATIDSLTDPFSGTFKTETEALQTSVDSLIARITQLDQLLASKKDRLFREFTAMENILSTLTSQQAAIGGISPLRIFSGAQG